MWYSKKKTRMYIQESYIGLVSSRLRNFKKVKSRLYNFSCPYCGDSQTNQKKSRGYLFLYKTTYVYKCHNCGISVSYDSFLKSIDEHLHKEYLIEKYKYNFVKPITTTEDKSTTEKTLTITDWIPVKILSDEHPCKKYVLTRKLPPDDLYYVDNFKEWIVQYNKDIDVSKLKSDENHRLIIPLRTSNGDVFGIQARSLKEKTKIRYITVMFKEHIKVFGLDKINNTKLVYVVEGPLDSLFLPNCIAMVGSDVNIDKLNLNNYVIILDNEPRNKIICDKLKSHINSGRKVVIWPNINKKDINDMVLSGIDVIDVIKNNTYQGLTANLKFNEWKKVNVRKMVR